MADTTILFPAGDGTSNNRTWVQVKAIDNGDDTFSLATASASGSETTVAIDQTTPGTTNGVVVKANPSETAATLAQAFKTVAASGTPEALGSGLVESVKIKARKSRASANTGSVFVGYTSGNDTQLDELEPGDEITLTAPDGKKINLAAIFIDVATNDDGVLFTTIN